MILSSSIALLRARPSDGFVVEVVGKPDRPLIVEVAASVVPDREADPHQGSTLVEFDERGDRCRPDDDDPEIGISANQVHGLIKAARKTS